MRVQIGLTLMVMGAFVTSGGIVVIATAPIAFMVGIWTFLAGLMVVESV